MALVIVVIVVIRDRGVARLAKRMIGGFGRPRA
jgi:hypothetical protein